MTRCITIAFIAFSVVVGLAGSSFAGKSDWKKQVPAGSKLAKALEIYEFRKDSLQKYFTSMFWTFEENYKWVLDGGDPSDAAELMSARIDSIFESLTDLRIETNKANVANGAAFLKSFGEWYDAEHADATSVQSISPRMAFTVAEMNMDYERWVDYAGDLEEKTAALKKLGEIMSKAYVHGEEVLLKRLDKDVLKAEAAIMRTFTYHARVLVDTLDHHITNIQEEVKAQLPSEKYAGKEDVARRLIKEAKFSDRKWTKCLTTSIKGLELALERTTEAYEKVVDMAEPILDESLLKDCGKPFKGLKYNKICKAFGALYGQIQVEAD